MKVDVYNIQGEKTGKQLELDDKIFGIKPNDHAIYLDVKRILASRRQGTHKTKERGEVKGSTRKLRRQKGIGAARVGSITNPLFRGGGRVFGPRVRDYSIKLNKKVKSLARKSALTYKLKDQQLLVIEDFQFDQPKTKNYFQILKSFKIDNKKSLLVIPGENENVYLSARNIQNAYICTPEKLNTYEILNNQMLIFTESAVEKVTKILN